MEVDKIKADFLIIENETYLCSGSGHGSGNMDGSGGNPEEVSKMIYPEWDKGCGYAGDPGIMKINN